MLDGLFKPKWQHSDPDVRRLAIAELAKDDAATLEAVARDDEAPALRQLALSRITDPTLLAERAGADPDPGVRERASKRNRQLLAGRVEDALPLPTRLDWIDRSDDTGLLEHLAREGAETELRERALAKVVRPAVLRDVALQDPDPALRLAALERVEDASTLERIYQRSRKSDKRISRRAREKLDALSAARERPQVADAQCQQICGAVEHLGRNEDWDRDQRLLEQLDARWQSLEEEYKQPHEPRYTAARERFLASLAEYRRTGPSIRARKEALIARLGTLAREPDREHPDAPSSLEAALREARGAWEQSGNLPEAEEHEFETRFHGACDNLRDTARRLRRESALAKLCRTSEKLLARKGPIAEQEVKALERQREAEGLVAQSANAGKLERRLERTHGKLRARLREQVERKDQSLASLPLRLDELEAAVKDSDAGRAASLHDEIQVELHDLEAMGVSSQRLGKLPSRFKSLAPQVRVIRAWSRFGADRSREQLCEELEGLIGADDDPEETARRIREARKRWKALSSGDPGMSHTLWRRFDAAATEAYKPCNAYFEARAEARKANLKRRQRVAQELEALVATTDWSQVDWKAVVRSRRELLAEWQQASPVEQKGAKALERRFRQQVEQLEAHLDRERRRNLCARENLLEQVTALHESADPKQAAEACKRLQRQWAVTVPGSRREENALWERFRSAADAVFAQRQQVFDQQRKAEHANLEQMRALRARVEALVEADGAGLAEADREFKRIESERQGIGPLPKREAAETNEHFEAAIRRFDKHRQALAAAATQASLERLQQKADLCLEAEALAATTNLGANHDPGASPDMDAVEALVVRWQGLAPVDRAEDEQRVQARFELARRCLNGDAVARAVRAKQQAANLEAREKLCLRMEILTSADSPPEHAQTRMAHQVARLSAALGQGQAASSDTLESLLRAWCLTGPAPAKQAEALEARFRAGASQC